MSKIILVGFGPGSADQMTFRAKEAIAEADVVIGYSTYVKLVEDLLEGKEVIKKGMTEEIDRCELAYAKAREGKTVALISSGDIGIYGMAGPMYEYLFEQGWTTTSKVTVEVCPGVTALSASASLVGAPLTHDFCSISLSDLLTPWKVIAGRLDAAGKADFVIALYNPKSSRRTGQIEEATRILLKYKSPETPVALVKSAYRKKEKIVFAQLKDLDKQDIGMLTTVIIGNKSTQLVDDLLVTPRGYSNKYDFKGNTLEGEEAGISLSTGLNAMPQQVIAALKEGLPIENLELKFGLPLGDILLLLDAERLDHKEVFNVTQVQSEEILNGSFEQLSLTSLAHQIPSSSAKLTKVTVTVEENAIAITAQGGAMNLAIAKSSYAAAFAIENLSQPQEAAAPKSLYLLDSKGYLAHLVTYE